MDGENLLEKKVKKFRTCSKEYGLTYSQYPGTKQSILDNLKTIARVQNYCIAQEEHKAEGTHIHAYVFFSNRLDSKNERVFDIVWKGKVYHPNIKRVEGGNANWLAYILKEDTEPLMNFKLGDKIKHNRTLVMREMMDYGAEEMKELAPVTVCTVKKAQDIIRSMEPLMLPAFPFQLHKWQRCLTTYLDQKMQSDRQILFLVDKAGGRGKTKFLSWLGHHPKSVYLNLEKRSDMLWMVPVDAERIFINVSKSGMEFLNYSLLETLKDGVWTCSKYQGKKCTLGVRGVLVQIVVAMNEEPDDTKLSKDRFMVWHLDMKINEVPLWHNLDV